MKKGQAVVVTTEFRGVFFGVLEKAMNGVPKEMTLLECRNCVYWDKTTKGFIGLAANGPSRHCRIGPAAPKMLINKITSIIQCSDDAAKAWRLEPWQ